MATINPYLNFMGNTEEAFLFYQSVFKTPFLALVRFKDTPEAGKLSVADREKIMHISLPIGKHNVIMGTDTLESDGHLLVKGGNVFLSIGTESVEEAESVFYGLSKDGTIHMPLQNTFWQSYFGMLIDQFGVKWMVNYDYPKQ